MSQKINSRRKSNAFRKSLCLKTNTTESNEANETDDVAFDTNQTSNLTNTLNDVKQNSADDWSAEDEIKLLYAALDNRPIGVFKDIQWALITEQFVNVSNRDIKEGELKAKYGAWYNLEELDKRDPLPFDNSQESFTLPAKYLTKEQIREYKLVCPDVVSNDKPAYVIDGWDDKQNNKIRQEVYSKLEERQKNIKEAKIKANSKCIKKKKIRK